MNGNYEWQKHQAKERSRARLQEAEGHRLAKQDAPPCAPGILHAALFGIFRPNEARTWLAQNPSLVGTDSAAGLGAMFSIIEEVIY